MGFTELAAGLEDFKKGVISLWFRVPSSVLGADPSSRGSRSTLPYTIPMMTLGRVQTLNDYQGDTTDVAVAGDEFPPPVYNSITSFSLASSSLLDPCHVGVVVPLSGDPFLRFNFRMEEFAVQSDIAWHVTTMTTYSLAEDPYTGPSDLSDGSGNESIVLESGGWIGTSSITDLSANLNLVAPEQFLVDSRHAITGDKWIHLLLSFDFSADCVTEAGHDTIDEGTSSACKLWYAIDDVNYDGQDNLGPFFVDDGDDPNAILTNNAYGIADSLVGLVGNRVVPASTCNWSSSPVPSSSAAIGFPVSSGFSDFNEVIEMADIQVFTGVSIDTSIEANRRAFVKNDGAGHISPASPKLAQTLLGKRPEILLRKGWASGTNDGTAGTFTKTGTISAFSPGP